MRSYLITAQQDDQMVKLGIIEAGAVDKTLSDNHGNYADMILEWLRPALKPKSSVSITLYENDALLDPREADIWTISGSKHGVYENIPWLNPLKNFIVSCSSLNIPLIGICFGHQIIAEAMDGKVTKSEKGWGVGVQKYELKNILPSIKKIKERRSRKSPAFYKGFAFHQDQIVKLPDNCTVIAGNDFCPNSLIAYGELAEPKIITIQTHPEFSSEYFRDLANLRRGKTIPSKLVDLALKDLECKRDNYDLALLFTSLLLK